MSLMTLRPYQKEAVDYTFSWLERNQGNPLVVLPTGSGKSHVIAEIINRLSHYKPRILVVTHVKELIAQNRAKLPKDIDAGIYSAGLRSRAHRNMVTFCGIQSVYKKAGLFGHVDLVMIDEAHLLPSNSDTMYRKFLSDLLDINPAMRIVGLTATPFRTDGVLFGDGNLFSEISYELNMARLVKECYLSPLKSRQSETQADMEGVKIVAGDYSLNQMSERHEAITKAAISEVVILGAERKSWLIFACSVRHCEMVRAALEQEGISCDVVTGDTPDRDEILKKYKNGQIRALINYGVLTTGFDAPATDLIVLLRSTQSTGLYVQILGRGMRTAHGKENCLVLDYGGNIVRHGPVDAIRIKTVTKSDGKKEAVIDIQPTIICPECRFDCHARAKKCHHCGHEFPVDPQHRATACQSAVMAADVPKVKMKVSEVGYFKNNGKKGKKDTLRVTYYGELGGKVSEWICLEHDGFAGDKARSWWKAMSEFGDALTPRTIDDAIMNTHHLKKPSHIEHKKENDFDRVYRYFFEEKDASEPSGNSMVHTESESEEIMW